MSGSRSGRLLLLALGLAIGVLGSELLVRLYARTDGPATEMLRNWDPEGVLIEAHGDAGYRPKPNTEFHYSEDATARINAQGFRGPVVAVPKPGDVYRIVLLGGSTTHGWGVGDGETIDANMRAILRARYPDRRIEVVNLAFDGYDSYQLAERFESDGVPLQPDLVIINAGINDVRNAPYRDLVEGDPRTLLWDGTVEDPAARSAGPLSTILEAVPRHSYLARLPTVLIYQLTSRVRLEAAQDDQVYLDAVDYFERNLRWIARTAAAREVPVLFSTPPSALKTARFDPDDTSARGYWLQDAEATQEYRDLLEDRTVDLVRALRSEGRDVEYIDAPDLPPDEFLDDAHLTPTGNRIVAERFVEAAAPYIAGR